MKKFELLMMTALISGSLSAQKLSEKEVPDAVKKAFASSYAGVKVQKWEKEGNLFEAEYKLNKVEYAASYDANGIIQENEKEINVSELPQNVGIYVEQKYPGAELDEASKITAVNGTVTYEIEIETSDDKEMDLLFDANGNFIKVEEKSAEKE